MSLTPYLNSFGDELTKIAEDASFKDKAKILGKNVLSFTAGSAAGALTAELANRAYKKYTGNNIPAAVIGAGIPLLGLAATMAYNKHKSEEQKEIANAGKNKTDIRTGRLS